jgi:hypothetical protein
MAQDGHKFRRTESNADTPDGAASDNDAAVCAFCAVCGR